MLNDVMLFLDRKELEFIKNEVVEAVTDGRVGDREWLIMLASKLIKSCEEDDSTFNAIHNGLSDTESKQ